MDEAIIGYMIPFSGGLLAYFSMLALVVGAIVGVIAGEGASRLFKKARGHSLLDATLGAVGLAGGIILCALLRYPTNTIYENLPGGGVVATTMHTYQHPYMVGLAISIVLPFGYELCRTIRRPEGLDGR